MRFVELCDRQSGLARHGVDQHGGERGFRAVDRHLAKFATRDAFEVFVAALALSWRETEQLQQPLHVPAFQLRGLVSHRSAARDFSERAGSGRISTTKNERHTGDQARECVPRANAQRRRARKQVASMGSVHATKIFDVFDHLVMELALRIRQRISLYSQIQVDTKRRPLARSLVAHGEASKRVLFVSHIGLPFQGAPSSRRRTPIPRLYTRPNPARM